jgi:ABC-type multidrug transport system ATPase subunit
MSQRLGVAMLGDPQVLLPDEPVNGLDPEGVLWIRNLMKRLATVGRTILVSSHHPLLAPGRPAPPTSSSAATPERA